MRDSFGTNSSLAGTGSLFAFYRRVSPDAIALIPFRDAAGDTFEASFSNDAAATAEHVAATADMSAKIREGMVAGLSSPPAGGGVDAFRGRGGGSDGVVQNKYDSDVGKLAAWLSAPHVEKAPQKKEPTP